MFRVLHDNNSMAYGGWIVDPNSSFEPGMIAQLTVFGNQIVCGVSDGRQPIGIIDDVKTDKFSTAVRDEVKIAFIPYAENVDGVWITPYDVIIELDNAGIIRNSFTSSPISVQLNEKNGTIIVPAGTPLNFSSTNSGVPDSIRVIVNYSYYIPFIPGENSTEGSGRITVWTSKIICATDIYDSSADYALNSVLFCGIDGKITTTRPDDTFPPIGVCTAPPSPIYPWLELKTFF